MKLTTNDTSQWVPCSIIKPVMKIVKAFLCQVPCGSIVEVWIKFVNYALET